MVAIPTRGELNPRCYDAARVSAASLRTTPVLKVGHLSVGANRTLIVQDFLVGDDEALVMIDDDVRPPADLSPLVEALGQFDVVAAAYPVFKPELWPLPVIAAWHENGLGQLGPIEGRGLVEADIVGTGCVAIRRCVLEDLPRAFQETIDADGNLVSDDVNFCRAARNYGYRVGVHMDVRCDHITTVSLGAVLQGALQLCTIG